MDKTCLILTINRGYLLQFSSNYSNDYFRLLAMDARDIYIEVGKRYSAAAAGVEAQYADSVAKSFGYTKEELSNIPQDANLGLSCGNPLAIATLREVSKS